MTWTYFLWSKDNQMTCTLIQAPKDLAEQIFQIREGFNPYTPACSDPGCCGPICSVNELKDDLEDFTAYLRSSSNYEVDILKEDDFTEEFKIQLLLES